MAKQKDEITTTELQDYLSTRGPTDPLPGLEQEPVFEQSVQSLYLDEFGREVPNPLPLAPPIGYRKQPTIADQMRNMIRLASHEARNAGAETEAEANDFDVGEDMDPHSPWENDFDIDPAMEAMLALQSRPPRTPTKPATPPASNLSTGPAQRPVDSPQQ